MPDDCLTHIWQLSMCGDPSHETVPYREGLPLILDRGMRCIANNSVGIMKASLQFSLLPFKPIANITSNQFWTNSRKHYSTKLDVDAKHLDPMRVGGLESVESTANLVMYADNWKKSLTQWIKSGSAATRVTAVANVIIVTASFTPLEWWMNPAFSMYWDGKVYTLLLKLYFARLRTLLQRHKVQWTVEGRKCVWFAVKVSVYSGDS